MNEIDAIIADIKADEAREQSAFPPVPVTAEALAVRWAQRDAEYAKRRLPLDPDAEASVRYMRMEEANRLPDKGERGRMWLRAKAWEAPRHADYGSMKDWLS